MKQILCLVLFLGLMSVCITEAWVPVVIKGGSRLLSRFTAKPKDIHDFRFPGYKYNDIPIKKDVDVPVTSNPLIPKTMEEMRFPSYKFPSKGAT